MKPFKMWIVSNGNGCEYGPFWKRSNAESVGKSLGVIVIPARWLKRPAVASALKVAAMEDAAAKPRPSRRKGPTTKASGRGKRA